MALALLLAVTLIVGLFAAVALFAPNFAPSLAAGNPGATASASLSGATDGPTGSPVPASPSSSTPSASATPSPTKASPTAVDKITAIENKVFDLVNSERVKAGCGKLRNDSRLHRAARSYSALMAEKNFFSHTGPDGSSFVDRVVAAGYPRSAAAAENIAYGYADAAAVMKGWMNSPGHRANILNCDLKAIGVGLAYRKSSPYWTQDFGRQ